MRDPLEAVEIDNRRAITYVVLALAAAVVLAVAKPNLFGTIAVILSFFVMIMLHEFGHFVMAKRAGMKVTEFFVGFGPRVWSVQKGETEYGLKAFPLGGYCRIIGMTNLEEVDPEDEPRAYRSKPFLPKLGVAPMPAGPAGPSQPMTGVDGWYINANSKNADLAVAFALQMVSPANEALFVKAGHIPADTTVAISDPITLKFADAVKTGFPRPQAAQLDNFWGNFDNALNSVIDKGTDPVQATKDACTAMNRFTVTPARITMRRLPVVASR